MNWQNIIKKIYLSFGMYSNAMKLKLINFGGNNIGMENKAKMLNGTIFSGKTSNSIWNGCNKIHQLKIHSIGIATFKKILKSPICPTLLWWWLIICFIFQSLLFFWLMISLVLNHFITLAFFFSLSAPRRQKLTICLFFHPVVSFGLLFFLL